MFQEIETYKWANKLGIVKNRIKCHAHGQFKCKEINFSSQEKHSVATKPIDSVKSILFVVH